MSKIFMLSGYLALAAIAYAVAAALTGSDGVAIASVSGTGCKYWCCDTCNGDCCVESPNCGNSCNCKFVDPFYCEDEFGYGSGYCQGTC